MGVKTRVVVFEGENFNSKFMDGNDMVAYIGNPMDLNVVLDGSSTDYRYSGGEYDPLDISPDIITVNALIGDKFERKLQASSLEQALAFGVLHGAAHPMGIAHKDRNNDYNPDFKKTKSAVNFTLDAPYPLSAISKGASMEDLFSKDNIPLTIGAWKDYFKRDAPEGREPKTAVDNYELNKVKERTGLKVPPVAGKPIE